VVSTPRTTFDGLRTADDGVPKPVPILDIEHDGFAIAVSAVEEKYSVRKVGSFGGRGSKGAVRRPVLKRAPGSFAHDSRFMPGDSGACVIRDNSPLPGNHHAFLVHGLVIAHRQPFGDPAMRPPVSWTPNFTNHAIVLGDRHDRSVLAEVGPPKAQRGPVDEGGAINVGPVVRNAMDGWLAPENRTPRARMADPA
jgi:hypothetical protein